MKKAGFAVLTATLLLTASACGGNDDSPDRAAQENQVVTSMAAELSKPADGLFDSASADCVAKDFVSKIGVARLEAVHAIDANGAYVANGALNDLATAAAYSASVQQCLGKDVALAKLTQISIAGYQVGTKGLLDRRAVTCVISRFAPATGVDGLFASKFVADTGEFVGSNESYDKSTATAFVNAMIDPGTTRPCVNYPRLQAKLAVQDDTLLDEAKLATCLARKTSTAVLKKTLIARLTASADAAGLESKSQAALRSCSKTSKK